MPRAPAVRAFFPTSQRQAIEDLACQAPAEVGWDVTHWSHRTLAQAAAEEEYVEAIHHTTVGTILGEAAFFHDLSPRIHVPFTPVDASWLNQADFCTGSTTRLA